MKKLVAIMLLCILSLSFVSCREYYENVSYHDENENCLVYRDNEYYVSPVFVGKNKTTAYEDDIKVGWRYSFPFGTDFYSDTAEDPIYIYGIGVDTNLYLKEGYDYRSEIFVIEGTSDPFVFSEAFIGPSFEYAYSLQSDQCKIVLRAQDHPRLKSTLLLFSDSEKYWIVFPTNEAYLVSPLFLDILKENQIIEE